MTTADDGNFVPGSTVPTEGPMDPAPAAEPTPKADEGKSVDPELGILGDQDPKEPTPKEEPKPEEGKQEPIEYTDFTAPEGMELDKGVVDSFKTVAKEAGLNQEQAQKLMDIATSHFGQLQTHAANEMKATRTQWVKDLQADPEFGGQNFNTTVTLAKRALNHFGTPELGTYLVSSGLGDNNHLVKAFAKIGKMISEDSFVEGNQTSNPKNAADVIFDGK